MLKKSSGIKEDRNFGRMKESFFNEQITKPRVRIFVFTIFVFIFCSLIFVQAQESYDSFNLEIEIADVHKEIQAGKDSWFSIKIINFANKQRADIILHYEILDGEGNEVTRVSETVAIETQASFVGKINVPELTENGFYILQVTLISQTGERQAKESFTVAEEKKRNEINVEFSLFDVTFNLEEGIIYSKEDLEGVVTFESFGNIPTPVDLNFIIRDEYGKDIYREKTNLTVLTEELLRWNYGSLQTLPYGNYTAVLQTLYNVDVFDEFVQDFEIRGMNLEETSELSKNKWFRYLIGIVFGIVLLCLLLFLIKKRNKNKKKSNK